MWKWIMADKRPFWIWSSFKMHPLLKSHILFYSIVDPVINNPAIIDPAINDLFSIVNDLWSTTFCLTLLATSIIWQKVMILLVSNDLNFFRHTTSGNIHEQTTACQIWQRSIMLEDQAVVAKGLSTSDSPCYCTAISPCAGRKSSNTSCPMIN